MQVALIKSTATTSYACIYYDKDGVSCSGTVFSTTYADSGTNIIELGYGF